MVQKTKLILEKAGLFDLRVAIPAKSGATRLHAQATLTPPDADVLGVRSQCFTRDNLIRPQFKRYEHDVAWMGALVTFSAQGVPEALQMRADRVHRFVFEGLGDGKKKPRKLRVRFVLEFSGEASVKLYEYTCLRGGAFGALTIEPEQAELPLQDQPEVRSGDDTIRRDYNSGRWSARIEVKTGPEGFVMTRRAGGPSGKLAQVAPQLCLSEREALALAAGDIRTWALKIARGGIRKDKAEASKLVEWCETFLQEPLYQSASNGEPEHTEVAQ